MVSSTGRTDRPASCNLGRSRRLKSVTASNSLGITRTSKESNYRRRYSLDMVAQRLLDLAVEGNAIGEGSSQSETSDLSSIFRDKHSPGLLLSTLNDDSSPDSGNTTFEKPSRLDTFDIDLNVDLYQASSFEVDIRSAERCLQLVESLSQALRSYLTELFWKFYNSCVPIIHKSAFLSDLENGYGDFCSPILHVAVLAIGLRFADPKRNDVQQLALPGRDSTLHRELGIIIGSRQQSKREVTYVQALILLADLEYGLGRSHTAGLYLDSACAIIIKVDSDRRNLNLDVSDTDIIVQRMVLRACTFVESQWALFDNKASSQLRTSSPNTSRRQQFHAVSQSSLMMHDHETQVFFAHLELIHIAGNTIRQLRSQPEVLTGDLLLEFVECQAQIDNWHSRLPEHLRWTEQKAHTVSSSLFLLHQQYHAVNILLNSHFGSNGASTGRAELLDDNADRQPNGYLQLCFTHATQLASILAHYRRRFECRTVFPVAILQAALAASIFISTIPRMDHGPLRDQGFHHLQCLDTFLTDMAATYELAERMAKALKAHLDSSRGLQRQGSTHVPQASVEASTPSSQEGLALNPALGGDFTWTGHDMGQQLRGYTEEAQPAQPHGNDFMDLTNDDTMNADLTIVEEDLASAQDGEITLADDPVRRCGSDSLGGKAATPLSVPIAQQEPSPRSTFNIAPATGPSPVQESTAIPNSISPSYSLEGWEDEVVDDSWSETFKTLGAINQQREAANSNANEFGVVCGIFFEL